MRYFDTYMLPYSFLPNLINDCSFSEDHGKLFQNCKLVVLIDLSVNSSFLEEVYRTIRVAIFVRVFGSSGKNSNVLNLRGKITNNIPQTHRIPFGKLKYPWDPIKKKFQVPACYALLKNDEIDSSAKKKLIIHACIFTFIITYF